MSRDQGSHYDTLQVTPDATLAEIRKSYQTLALRYHPDKSGPNRTVETEQFMRIDKAWKVLRDEHARRIYDAELMQQTCKEEYFVNEILSRQDFVRDDQEGYSYYVCRCGGYYILPEDEKLVESVHIPCDECSLVVLVNPG